MYFSLTAIAISFLVGFAMKRGGLCTYAAVVQMVNRRRAERMFVFLGASAWAALITLPLFWLDTKEITLTFTHDHLFTALLAGLVLGIGAYLNRGCVFGTFVQLVGGNLSYFATLVGMAGGVALTQILIPDLIPATSGLSIAASPNPIAFGWLFAVGIFAIAIAFQASLHGSSLFERLKALHIQRWETAFTMVVIGIGGGLLYSSVSGWDYSGVLTNISIKAVNTETPTPSILAISCSISMIIGGLYAAISAGNFSIKAPSLQPFLRSLAGGALMGGAAMIVPGGNDTLLLKGIPGLAPHAILAYGCMVGVMLALVYGAKGKINCA